MNRGLKIVGALCAVGMAVLITAFAFDPRERTPDEIVSADDAATTTRSEYQSEDASACAAFDASSVVLTYYLIMVDTPDDTASTARERELFLRMQNHQFSPGIVREGN